MIVVRLHRNRGFFFFSKVNFCILYWTEYIATKKAIALNQSVRSEWSTGGSSLSTQPMFSAEVQILKF